MIFDTFRINWSHYAKVCEARQERALPVSFDLFYVMNKKPEATVQNFHLSKYVKERHSKAPHQAGFGFGKSK